MRRVIAKRAKPGEAIGFDLAARRFLGWLDTASATDQTFSALVEILFGHSADRLPAPHLVQMLLAAVKRWITVLRGEDFTESTVGGYGKRTAISPIPSF